MTQRKHLVFTLVVVMMAFMALSVGTVLAGGVGERAFTVGGHAPVCEKTMVQDGTYLLECFDVDEDIIAVEVVANVKYDLQWNGSRVALQVDITGFNDVVRWSVRDKMGHTVAGYLP